MTKTKFLPRHQDCFVCGLENSAGAGVQFYLTDNGVEGDYVILEKHVGYKGIVHGGIISALLDECIGRWVNIQAGKLCVTRELNIKFKHPIPVNTHIIIKAVQSETQSAGKRFIMGSGHIVDKAGKVYAQAEGRFFPMLEHNATEMMSNFQLDHKPGEIVTAEDIWGD